MHSEVLAKPANLKTNFVDKCFFQVRLLIWKRYAELSKQKSELAKLLIVPLLFFVLLILFYSVFTGIFAPDGLEEYIVPVAFWILTQKTVINVTFEKSNKLQEALKMMGLLDISYWTSFFLTDGVIIGFAVAFLADLISLYGLFNNADFGTLLGLFFVYGMSGTAFSFFLCSFFDTPQSAGQVTILVLLGLYVVYLAADIGTSSTSLQSFMCLFPPIALQLGSGSFKKSYKGVDISTICGIMFADVFIYSLLAWYFSQVWITDIGVAKPWYFIFQYSYWKTLFTNEKPTPVSSTVTTPLDVESREEISYTFEPANETILGKPTIQIHKLKKTFGAQVAVNNISLKMYENQIFALLGHNGAGKTTTINMLTGLISAEIATGGGASIYGNSIDGEMEIIRQSMGVCPQHDVLFDHLTVREHILLASQLKGYSYQQANEEAVRLTNLFHLEKRLDHTGSELSGGQKRKLSVSLAICGGSKFVVLDEPTAGMDPLARRELWDLLASLRVGRTMLLTTHYMDEADVLGDRVAIMSLGVIQCLGTTQFLKTTYGAGYKLIFDKGEGFTFESEAMLTKFISHGIPESKLFKTDGDEHQIQYVLPFTSVKHFGPFFESLETQLSKFHVSNFGVSITSLEDVFLKVGEDHSVTPKAITEMGIGSDRTYLPSFIPQLLGIVYRKLNYAVHDFVTLALVGIPICCTIVVAGLYSSQVISTSNLVNDLIAAGIYIVAYLGVVGLLAEFIVRERVNKLRNVLTVMGCGFEAYWIGSFIADYIILFIPLIPLWISWPAAGMSDFYGGDNGLVFFLFLLFNAQLILFAYATSYMFTNPKSCIAFLPFFVIFLLLLPNIVILFLILIFDVSLHIFSISSQVSGGALLWGTMILSPHGALFSALLATTQDFSSFVENYPPVGATIGFMIGESILFFGIAYMTDRLTISKLESQVDPTFDPKILATLDEDVTQERMRAQEKLILNATNMSRSGMTDPLYVNALRKVFPPKSPTGEPLVAVQDLKFSVQKGEIFGLLGANGAGKTTCLSMLTRHLIPTSGDAYVGGKSILSQFSLASTNLGVVTQNNSLWDLLSVEDHLYLFARLRGVPEDLIKSVVEGTIDQLELTPHRYKLSERLSGGMKRKLCVAIALIGDPQVVLLDEPSAGLDPVSRRNLWSVILRTMSHRSVILTTHSMEEAEALCARIGIMVKGQLRALGTKQHLKTKFSSGYELAVKLKSLSTSQEEFTRQVNNLNQFVESLFAGSTLISENGGLLTYRIPKEEMNIGKSFSAFEGSKDRLDIEDYSISQPTLEQVFIRTVNENSDIVAARVSVGGGYRVSVEGTGLLDDTTVTKPARVTNQVFWQYNLSEFDRQLNICGCNNFQVKVMAIISALLFLLFAIIAIFGKVAALFAIAIIAFIVTIIGCVLLYCPCCKKATGSDE